MARLYRPYIPLAVRLQVAERQLGECGGFIVGDYGGRKGARLAAVLKLLFGDKPFALDHDPALMNRRVVRRVGAVTFYSPPANDPRFLKYREAGPGSDHDIKTRVRGDGAQHSDLALARIRKRKERKASRPKTRWPAGRKFQNRGFR